MNVHQSNAPCRHCERPLANFHGPFARCSGDETQYEPMTASHELYLLDCRLATSDNIAWRGEVRELYLESIRREQAAGLGV